MNIGGFLRRNGVGIVMLTIGAGFIAAVISPAILHDRDAARRSSCQSNLHDIMKACLLYQEDNNGYYPPLSDGGSQGWTTILQQSVSTVPLSFSCPNTSSSPYEPTSDYFFNAQLANRKESSVREPDLTISFGEGPDNGPSNSHYWELPNDDKNPDSVLVRHDRYSNYAFADGHVKMVAPGTLRRGYEFPQPQTLFRFAPDDRTSKMRR